ncbi:hypothetical protein F3Y22_tig00008386pilonHSYRG00125 [Hibiscus syriacus]|uniref:Uncharacterized protein n=1 Tax=Hibiscus syriacus TaxID=106335 RepID=A0A6A3CD27_HIBSY|nr:hypothetical protein F3Y22_tig00008386pilonHSYRG00125 [Hibiscus syriacus]
MKFPTHGIADEHPDISTHCQDNIITKMKDTSYYDVLGVNVDAPLLKSRRLITEKLGKFTPIKPRGSKADEKFMLHDPAAVFGMAFGSEYFDEYVGQLQMATLASVELEDTSLDREARLQRLKEMLAKGKKGLSNSEKGSSRTLMVYATEFIDWANSEAQRLLKLTIGYVYTRKGASELGKETPVSVIGLLISERKRVKYVHVYLLFVLEDPDVPKEVQVLRAKD